MYKSKVYVLLDKNNRIIRCEGGYTMSNITNIDEWIFIDEGQGDKYNLCQSHYFEGGLYTVDFIPRYKLVDGAPELRTDEEIDADRVPVTPAPTTEERVTELENLMNIFLGEEETV